MPGFTLSQRPGLGQVSEHGPHEERIPTRVVAECSCEVAIPGGDVSRGRRDESHHVIQVEAGQEHTADRRLPTKVGQGVGQRMGGAQVGGAIGAEHHHLTHL